MYQGNRGSGGHLPGMEQIPALVTATNILLTIALLGTLLLAIRIGRRFGIDVVTAVLYLRKKASMRAAGGIVVGTGLFFLAQSLEFFAPDLHTATETLGLAFIVAGSAGFVAILRFSTRKTPVVTLRLGEMPE